MTRELDESLLQEIATLKTELAAARNDAKSGWAEVDRKNGMLDGATADNSALRKLCAEASGTMRLCACCQKNEIVDKLRSAGRGEGTR